MAETMEQKKRRVANGVIITICASLIAIFTGFVILWKNRVQEKMSEGEDLHHSAMSSSSKLGQKAPRRTKSKMKRKTELGVPKAVETEQKSESQVILSDPAMNKKWGLDQTEANRAWNITQGSRNIVVAIIDTGIDVDHEDLRGNLWVNQGESGVDSSGKRKETNGVDDDGNGFVDDVHGWNFVNNNNDLSDHHGHGTHIAGIVGARGGNGVGTSGISPQVSLMALKYYDPSSFNNNNLKNTVSAIEYATRMGVHIINYSGGGLEHSQAEYDAIKRAQQKGILFVAAAGNEKSNSDHAKYYPADYDLSNIISVTAVDPHTKVLPTSNYGVHTVDIAAPGLNIHSTLPHNQYGTMTGTSQATAFVTGVAALIRAYNSEFDAAAIKRYILQTGDERPHLLTKTGTSKQLNSFKALSTLDQGVGLTGVVARNTAKMKPSRFAIDSVASDDPALRESSDRQAKQMLLFGQDLIQILRKNRGIRVTP